MSDRILISRRRRTVCDIAMNDVRNANLSLQNIFLVQFRRKIHINVFKNWVKTTDDRRKPWLIHIHMSQKAVRTIGWSPD